MRKIVLGVAAVVAGTLLTTASAPAAQAATTGGALWGWGANGGGEVGIDWVTDFNHPINNPVRVSSVPADVVQADTTAGFGAAVRADGSVWVWGTSNWLQGDGGAARRPAPHPVPGLPPIAKISLAWDAAFAVARDGSLWAWGDNTAGQFGTSVLGFRPTPVKLVDSGVVDVANTHNAAAYLTSGGAVLTAGTNAVGGLGNGTFTERPGFNAAWTPAGVTQLAATDNGFVALRSDGSVWVWGAQYGHTPLASPVAKPARVEGVLNIKQIAAGLDHVLALAKDGTVWSWGDNTQGQLGTGTLDRNGVATASPVHLGLTGITQVNAADENSGAIRSDQMLMAWGGNPGDRLGLGNGSGYVTAPTLKNDLFGVGTAVVGSTAFAVATSVTVVPREIVPSVTSQAGAASVLHDAGLSLGNTYTTPDDRYCGRLGQVKTQSPAAGTLVPFGSRVDITVYVRPAQPCL